MCSPARRSRYRLLASGVMLLGLSAGSPNQNFDYGICYQLGGGTLTTFQTYLTSTITATARLPFSASSVVTPGAGTYTVGMCVRNTGAAAINSNDWVNGFIMVTN